MNFKKRNAAVLAAALLVLVSACSTGADGDKPESGGTGDGYRGVPQKITPAAAEDWANEQLQGKKVFFAAADSGYPLADQYLNVYQEAFEQLGIEYKFLDAGSDPQREVQNAQTLLNQKPDVLIVHALDSSSLNTLIEEAQSQGVYVVNQNLITTRTTDVYVGGNFKRASMALATDMSQACKVQGKSKVAVIRGYAGDGLSLTAGDAYNEAFEENGIEVVADQAADYNPTKAHDLARVVLQQHPDLCGFIGTWDLMMLGAADAVDRAGMKGDVLVYTSDSSATACDALASGSLTKALDYGVGIMPSQIVSLVQNLLLTEPGAGNSSSIVFPRYKVLAQEDVQGAGPLPGCYTGNPL